MHYGLALKDRRRNGILRCAQAGRRPEPVRAGAVAGSTLPNRCRCNARWRRGWRWAARCGRLPMLSHENGHDGMCLNVVRLIKPAVVSSDWSSHRKLTQFDLRLRRNPFATSRGALLDDTRTASLLVGCSWGPPALSDRRPLRFDRAHQDEGQLIRARARADYDGRTVAEGVRALPCSEPLLNRWVIGMCRLVTLGTKARRAIATRGMLLTHAKCAALPRASLGRTLAVADGRYQPGNYTIRVRTRFATIATSFEFFDGAEQATFGKNRTRLSGEPRLPHHPVSAIRIYLVGRAPAKERRSDVRRVLQISMEVRRSSIAYQAAAPLISD